MTADSETVESYVIDIACVRKNPRDALLEKAETHPQNCALMGHCVESGYGIVTEDARLTALDPDATPKVVGAVEAADAQTGIRLCVVREETDGEMETTTVEKL